MSENDNSIKNNNNQETIDKEEIQNNQEDNDDYKLSTVNLLANESLNVSNSNSNKTNDSSKASSQNNINDNVKKPKKNVKFNNVEIYLFDRKQGFQSIPSDTYTNSFTIGMEFKHSEVEVFETVDEFLRCKRKVQLNKLEDALKESASTNDENNDKLFDDNDEALVEIDAVLSKKEEYENNIELELPIKTAITSEIFCPILSPNKRTSKLIEFGYTSSDIDESEVKEIVEIKKARLVNVGCKCKDKCGENGELCSCATNGISCQLDKTKYPCNCTSTKCKNPNGIKKFNLNQVQKHWKATLGNLKETSINDSGKGLTTTSILATPEIKRRKRRKFLYSPKKRSAKKLLVTKESNETATITVSDQEAVKKVDVNIIKLKN